MRVIAGELRGRRISGPRPSSTAATRPTSDRVREAVFNILGSMGGPHLDGPVVDLFAGTGAFGIEAVSRGSQHCTFVEQHPEACAAIRRDLASLGIAQRCDVVHGDALSAVRSAAVGDAGQLRGAAVAFADPPYGYAAWPSLLAALHASQAHVVVCEAERPVDAQAGSQWRAVRKRAYGRSAVTVLARQ